MAERRRGRGEGSTYRRKDGRWVGQYEINEKRRFVHGQTRKASEQPELNLTLDEVADAVDQTLQEVSQVLLDVLSDEDQDEQAERDRWWASHTEEHPHGWYRGGVTEGYPLPRNLTTSSWYEGAPE
jgi:hypothetical protein